MKIYFDHFKLLLVSLLFFCLFKFVFFNKKEAAWVIDKSLNFVVKQFVGCRLSIESLNINSYLVN